LRPATRSCAHRTWQLGSPANTRTAAEHQPWRTYRLVGTVRRMGGGDMAVDTTIRAAIFDYGGVLTTAGRPAIEQWTQRERIRPDSFSAVLKAWLSRDAPRG